MRSHYCGQVTEALLGQDVELCGWVHRRRDHGGVIFIDLRDNEGLVQIVFHPEQQQLFKQAEMLRGEYVVRVTGTVRSRPEGTVNANLTSGKIEIAVKDLQILNRSEPLPFPIDEYHAVGEEMRLRYRYLDLRRPEMAYRLRLRSQATRVLRNFLDARGFMDIETPALTRSTPEGARDYLVPSRVHLGNFYALPQSPQQFKQLLMMAGMDRYYQIVRCFRDEDLRADRQPEFTQLDMEMSFIDEAQIQTLVEDMVRELFSKLLNIALPNPFPRMTYAEAMSRYGSDKPDLRIPLELRDIGDLVKDVEFKVFASAANDKKSRVAVLHVPGGADLSRKELDDYTKYVSNFGAKGLAYIKVNDRAAGVEGLQSPIVKFLPPAVVEAILARTEAATGDILFFGADSAQVVNDSLGALRLKLGHDRGLVTEGWKPLWIVDFPMFEKDKETVRWQAIHHPFTAPKVDSIEQLETDPGNCLSRAYDMVLNGTEAGGGSIRIHNPEMQYAVFRLLGIDAAEAKEKFGHLLEALSLGCPPHGGIAFGLDRLIMLMAGATSIRDVIAFPKTQTGACPLMNAPATVDPKQLIDLGIRIAPQPTK